MKPKAIALIVALTVVAGGAAFYLSKYYAAPDDLAVGLAPKDSVVYVSLFVNPSNDQKRAIDGILKRFPQIEGLEEQKNMLFELLDEGLASSGITVAGDIEPWLGDQLAFFLLPFDPSSGESPDGAVLIQTDDEGATRETIDKVRERQAPGVDLTEKEHGGVTYQVEDRNDGSGVAFGFVEGFLALGTESGVTAVIEASQGAPIEESERFQRTTEGLADDYVARAYVDLQAVLDAIPPSPEADLAQLGLLQRFLGDGGAAFSIHAVDDAAVLETATPADEAVTLTFEGQGPIPGLPSSAWAALALPKLGEYAEGLLDLFEEMGGDPNLGTGWIENAVLEETGLDLRDDILSWMGDAAVFVRGTRLADIGGAIEVESGDRGTMNETLDSLASYADTQQPGLLQPKELEIDGGALSGYSFEVPGVPVPFNFFAGDSFIASVGDPAAVEAAAPVDTLEGSDTFDAAMEGLGDFAPSFYVEVGKALELVDSLFTLSGQTDPVYESDVKPVLEHLRFGIAGLRVEGDLAYQRLVIGVK